MGKVTCDITFDVVKQSCSDLESLFLLTEERMFEVLSKTIGAHGFMEDIIKRVQMEERQCGIVGTVSSTKLCIIKGEI